MPRDPALNAMSPIGVLCFADGLFTPRPPAPGAKPRYQVILLLNKIGVATTAYQDLRRAVAAAISAKWGATKAADPNFVRTLRLPFRQAADKTYEGFEDGEIYINPWLNEEKGPPGVTGLRPGSVMTQGEVWSGQLARLTVRAFAYDTSGNKGVAFGLEHAQIMKADMPRIDGRRTASEAFKNASLEELEAYGIDPKEASAAAASSAGDELPF